MHFVFQVFNDRNGLLPKEIGLLQLFVDLDNIPFNNKDEGFVLKVYQTPTKEKAVNILNPKTDKSEMALWELHILAGCS